MFQKERNKLEVEPSRAGIQSPFNISLKGEREKKKSLVLKIT